MTRIEESLEPWNTHPEFDKLCRQAEICISQNCFIEEIRMRIVDFSNMYQLYEIDQIVTIINDLKEIINQEK